MAAFVSRAKAAFALRSAELTEAPADHKRVARKRWHGDPREDRRMCGPGLAATNLGYGRHNDGPREPQSRRIALPLRAVGRVIGNGLAKWKTGRCGSKKWTLTRVSGPAARSRTPRCCRLGDARPMQMVSAAKPDRDAIHE